MLVLTHFDFSKDIFIEWFEYQILKEKINKNKNKFVYVKLNNIKEKVVQDLLGILYIHEPKTDRINEREFINIKKNK